MKFKKGDVVCIIKAYPSFNIIGVVRYILKADSSFPYLVDHIQQDNRGTYRENELTLIEPTALERAVWSIEDV